ncbi:MAG: hypothetical protein JNK72_15690 [Myxococcales bacterium]|nr:hypothetical protein [Myxococcales bacterium]
MSTGNRLSSLMPRPDVGSHSSSNRRLRDPYADLLRDTRNLRREQAQARDAWYAALPLERKEDTLFEFEMLLKGLVAWANPRNHPRIRPTLPPRDRNFRPHLLVAREGLARVISLITQLLGAQRHAVDFGRYLPVGFSDEPLTEVPPGAQSIPPPGPGGGVATVVSALPESPHESLVKLRHGLSAVAEIVDGLLHLERVPFRLFFATVSAVGREVSRVPLFDPLYVLEFRPEFDRIRVQEVLDAMQSIESDVAHRFVALGFLSQYRLARVASLWSLAAAEGAAGTSRGYLFLATLRAEARALTFTLQTSVGGILGDAFERDCLRVTAHDIRARYDVLARETERLTQLRSALGAAAATLRAELRRACEREVVPCDWPTADNRAELAQAMALAAAHLKAALQGNILHLVSVLKASVVDPEKVFAEKGAKALASEQLRRDAWMFSLVLRAFVTRAQAHRGTQSDAWSVGPAQGYVAQFLRYFQAFGQRVAFETRYPQLDRLRIALDDLRDADYLDTALLQSAVAECESLGGYLTEVTAKLSAAPELRARALDRFAAAETLVLYME